jgi:hypothetical protein
MRPWAEWTAKTALTAAVFAAAGGGLSGAAFAGTSGGSPSGLGNNLINAPASIPADVCGIAGALIGIATADCGGGATAVTHLPATGGSPSAGSAGGNLIPSGNTVNIPVSVPATVCGAAASLAGQSTARCAGGASASIKTDPSGGLFIHHAATPKASALGSTADPLAGLGPVSGLTLVSGLTGSGGGAPGLGASGLGASGFGVYGFGGDPESGPGLGSSSDQPFSVSPGAGSGAGGAGDPSASQLVGLGILPGLGDLPSLAGLANMPALTGQSGGGIPLPGTALTAATTSGMGSDSFAALAVGSLLAGASALKIAGRRARDRKAGIGVAV